MIMPAQYIKVAAPAGLMSVVDNLLLFRCVQIVRRLTQKSREIGVFCNISGDTLADSGILPPIPGLYAGQPRSGRPDHFRIRAGRGLEGGRGRRAATLPISQGWALRCPWIMSRLWRWISCKLKLMGFRHLKVRADMLTGGMSGAGAAVAAEDFKKLLARHGLNLIAERVEDEKTVVQLLDYTVDFAQGFLFGEPRAVREDGAQRKSRAGAGGTACARPVDPFRRAVRSGAMSRLRLISGLREIAPDHDALICDIWGVVHNGNAPFPEAAEALRHFRRERGPVVLLSNAPRMPQSVEEQFRRIGVATDCYDAIVTSGGAARADLAAAREWHSATLLYRAGTGPSLLEGLDVRRAAIAEADVALCIGLQDDLIETPADYSDILAAMRARNLPMLCANPDLKVYRGSQLVLVRRRAGRGL